MKTKIFCICQLVTIHAYPLNMQAQQRQVHQFSLFRAYPVPTAESSDKKALTDLSLQNEKFAHCGSLIYICIPKSFTFFNTRQICEVV